MGRARKDAIGSEVVEAVHADVARAPCRASYGAGVLMATCFTATCDELAERLAAAESAYHTAMLGGAVEEVQSGENRVRYSKAGDLLRYISALRSQMKTQGCITCSQSRVFGIVPIDNNRCR